MNYRDLFEGDVVSVDFSARRARASRGPASPEGAEVVKHVPGVRYQAVHLSHPIWGSSPTGTWHKSREDALKDAREREANRSSSKRVASDAASWEVDAPRDHVERFGVKKFHPSAPDDHMAVYHSSGREMSPDEIEQHWPSKKSS